MAARASEMRVHLAGRQAYEVSLCEHGVIHLHLGGVTAHLDRAAFEQVCGALLEARERLRRGEQSGCGPGLN